MQKITIQQSVWLALLFWKLEVGENRKDAYCKKKKQPALEGGGSERALLPHSLFGPIITCTSSSVFMQETKQGDWSKDESF